MCEWVRETHVTNRVKYANADVFCSVLINFMRLVLVHAVPPFCPLQSGCGAVWFFHTWAEGITSQLLDALALAYGAAIERSRVGAAARALLVTTAAATVAHRPLGPRRPSTVHWREKKKKNYLEMITQVPVCAAILTTTVM